MRTISARVTALTALAVVAGHGNESRLVVPTRGQLPQNRYPGYRQLGHPAPVTTVHRGGDASSRSPLMSAQITFRPPSIKHSGTRIEPPLTIERWVRAWEIVGNQVGRWEVRRIEESAAQVTRVLVRTVPLLAGSGTGTVWPTILSPRAISPKTSCPVPDSSPRRACASSTSACLCRQIDQSVLISPRQREDWVARSRRVGTR
jgi:hypothetical protein